MKNKYRVTYDSAEIGTFTVHKPGALLHFVMHQDGLHYHDKKNGEVTLIQTVQENEEVWISVTSQFFCRFSVVRLGASQNAIAHQVCGL